MTWPQWDAEHLIIKANQMIDVEKKILSSGLPEEALMEKVGQYMSRWLLKKNHLLRHGIVVLVGPGHNGGDGLVIARELHLAGKKVRLWCPLTIKKQLTLRHIAYCRWLGIPELQIAPDSSADDLWIDAVFGVGQRRSLPSNLADLFEARRQNHQGKLIAIDIPSGLCSDSGKPFKNIAAYASWTLVVGLFKRGLIQDFALPHVGNLVRFDIGVPEKILFKESKGVALRVCSKDLSNFKWPNPSPIASKYERGRLLILAGSEKYPGAALLSMQGALSSGAGLVQAALPSSLAKSFVQHCPEIVLAGLLKNAANQSSLIGPFINEYNFERIDALLLGPGLGISEENWNDISFKLEKFVGLLVLDADAINRLALSDNGWRWLRKRCGPTVLTPHKYEFERLFKGLDYSNPIEAAFKASSDSGSGVLLKGAHSVFASPCGDLWQLGETSPCAARAGFGDVLAGFIAGIGAMASSNLNEIDWSIFAASALMHAHAGKTCPNGSTASSIASFLGTLMKGVNTNQCLEKDT